jgi:hypothetical protein
VPAERRGSRARTSAQGVVGCDFRVCWLTGSSDPLQTVAELENLTPGYAGLDSIASGARKFIQASNSATVFRFCVIFNAFRREGDGRASERSWTDLAACLNALAAKQQARHQVRDDRRRRICSPSLETYGHQR